jgi:hypothetical protein
VRVRDEHEAAASSSAREPARNPQWLRRDDEAPPSSEIVVERPESILSGRTLARLLG